MKNGAIFCTLAGVILLLALGGGGIVSWPLWLAALILTLALAIARWRHRHHSALESPSCRWMDFVFLLLFLFMGLTALPLPLPATFLSGAQRHHQNARVEEAMEMAHQSGIITTAPPAFSATRNRAGTLRMMLLVAATWAAWRLAGRLPPVWKRRLLRFILWLGLSIGLCGLAAIVRYPQGDTLLWLIPIEHCLPGPVACFINPNHFAGFLAILLPLSFICIVEDFINRRWASLLLSGAAAMIMGIGMAASLSRGAILAGAAGLIATAAFLAIRRRILPAAGLLVFVTVFAAAIWTLPAQPLRDELKTLSDPTATESFKARGNAWRDTLTVWRDYPLIGAGMNALRTTYPVRRESSASGYLTHAENEYVQVLAEGGLIGTSLIALLLLVAGSCLRRSLALPHGDLCIQAGVVGALAVAATHAALDFAIRIPLYTVTLASLLGTALPLDPPCSAAPAKPASSPAPTAPFAWLGTAGLAILILLLTPTIHDIARLDSPTALKTADPSELTRALTWAPTSSRAWYYLGRHACSLNTTDSCRFGEICLSRAAEYDPMSYAVWRQLGMLRMKLGDIPGARDAFARVRALRAWVAVPELPEDQP